MSDSRLDKVAVALDTSDADEFRRWCRLFGPRVGVLKVGLECFYRLGPSAIEQARRHAQSLFLDLKLHDIPNTVAGAVSAVEAMGADYLTVHSSGGRAMLDEAVARATTVKLLAVTLLTHLDAGELERLGLTGSGPARVESWARLALEAGCAGAVSSPLELDVLRPALPHPFLLVTPGIRPAGVDRNDQRRVSTPREALAAGADLLVIGRPLTRSSDPGAALERLAEEIEGSGERSG